MIPLVIGPANGAEAKDAIRDILMMYVGLTEYAGFGHLAAMDVRFDPLRFVDAVAEHDPGYTPWVDMDLLRTGAAIAALCAVYDIWVEDSPLVGPWTRPVLDALAEGRFRHTPDVEAVLREAFRRDRMELDDPWFDAVTQPIYDNHVRRFFATLAEF